MDFWERPGFFAAMKNDDDFMVVILSYNIMIEYMCNRFNIYIYMYILLLLNIYIYITGWGPPVVSWFINHEITPIN